MTIEVLSPAETEAALKGSAVRNEQLSEVGDTLMALAPGQSVFVADLSESFINMLRTKVSRKGAKLTARKVRRGGEVGHILQVTSK